MPSSAPIDQRSDQICRPDETDRGTCQRFERWVAPVGQIDHVMAEMSKHSREIEARGPPPDMLVLARAGRLWRSKGKDSASKLGQSRRADHGFHPHACNVTVNNRREHTGATLSTTRYSCAEGRRGAFMIPGLPAVVTPAASLCPEQMAGSRVLYGDDNLHDRAARGVGPPTLIGRLLGISCSRSQARTRVWPRPVSAVAGSQRNKPRD
jgi:hypothetical protein